MPRPIAIPRSTAKPCSAFWSAGSSPSGERMRNCSVPTSLNNSRTDRTMANVTATPKFSGPIKRAIRTLRKNVNACWPAKPSVRSTPPLRNLARRLNRHLHMVRSDPTCGSLPALEPPSTLRELEFTSPQSHLTTSRWPMPFIEFSCNWLLLRLRAQSGFIFPWDPRWKSGPGSLPGVSRLNKAVSAHVRKTFDPALSAHGLRDPIQISLATNLPGCR